MIRSSSIASLTCAFALVLTACSGSPDEGGLEGEEGALEGEEVGVTHQAIEANASVVISQVYPVGRVAGSPYGYDFVEIFNRGDHPVSLAGWSIQYASATGNGRFGHSSSMITPLPNQTLQPGRYLVIRGAGTGGPQALPAGTVTDPTPISLSKYGGKVALVRQATTVGCNGGSLPCTAQQLALMIDVVGYGTANFYEGSGPAPVASADTSVSVQRWLGAGCIDTNVNANDLVLAATNPRPASGYTLCFNFGTTP